MDNIESIEKGILFINTLKVTHKLVLGKSNQTKQKISNIVNNEYTSSKYSNFQKVSNLKINTSDYLVFEHTYNLSEKKKSESIYFSYPNLYELRKAFKKAVSWFTKYKDLHVETEEGVYLRDEYANLFAECYGASDKRLVIRPNVFEIDSEYYKGVNIIINDVAVTQIEYFDLLYLYDFLRTFDLYSSSLMLLQTKEIYVNTATKPVYNSNTSAGSTGTYKPKTRRN